MTYAGFLLLFLIVPTLLQLWGIWQMEKRGHLSRAKLHHHWQGIAILACVAFVWTTPWDNYLIFRGVWDSPADRVFGRIFYVPLEEYAFFILMPLFNGAVLCWFLRGLPKEPSTWRLPQWRERLVALLFGLLIFCGGLYSLSHERGLYLGLILVWFTPPILIQWLFDPAALLRAKRIVLLGTLLPAIYLGLVDSYAIQKGIWVISEAKTTGLRLPNLPLEELLFFAVTSFLLSQGIVLWHSINRPPKKS
jgi:putative membrane protein